MLNFCFRCSYLRLPVVFACLQILRGLQPDTAKLSTTSPPGQQSRIKKEGVHQCQVLQCRVLHF